MAWKEDLSPFDDFGTEIGATLRAVGWLERDHPYPTGEVDRRVFDRLVEFAASPWQPWVVMGFHECDLCRYRGEAFGKNNLFIPGEDVIFICPELICHYMNAHSYEPPATFCQAVLACPPMQTMDYRKALLSSGGRPLVKSLRA